MIWKISFLASSLSSLVPRHRLPWFPLLLSPSFCFSSWVWEREEEQLLFQLPFLSKLGQFPLHLLQ